MKLLKIYGERSTNTNYLGELIGLNLDVTVIPGVAPRKMRQIQTKLPAKDLLRDIYFELTFHRNLGWKDFRVKEIEQLRRYPLVKYHEVCFVTITKNPYSWLLSLYRRPYHQHYTTKPSFEKFLETTWRTVHRENLQTMIFNPVQLWNITNRSSLPLDGLQVLNLTSESIFLGAENAIRDSGISARRSQPTGSLPVLSTLTNLPNTKTLAVTPNLPGFLCQREAER